MRQLTASVQSGAAAGAVGVTVGVASGACAAVPVVVTAASAENCVCAQDVACALSTPPSEDVWISTATSPT
jgi:hypothetical protein